MQDPDQTWLPQAELNGDGDVLSLRFGHGVELRVAGERGLRTAHWRTTPEFDPEEQRAEVARAIEWAREHDEELRARIRAHHAARRVAADARRIVAAARGIERARIDTPRQ